MFSKTRRRFPKSLQHIWRVWGCWLRCFSGTDNSEALSGLIFRVWSFVTNACCVLSLSDTISKTAEILMCCPRAEFTTTLVLSRPDDSFFDLIAKSISGVILISTAVKVAFWILASTVSTILPISLSIPSLKLLSKVFTLTNPHWVLIYS